MVLSASALQFGEATVTSEMAQHGGQSDRVEGAASAPQSILEIIRPTKTRTGYDGCSTRAAGVYLGDRCSGRAQRSHQDERPTQSFIGKATTRCGAERSAVQRHTEWRILVPSYAIGRMPELAPLVRGSSRRITTMMAGLAVWSASRKTNGTESMGELDRSLHIRRVC